MSDFHDHLATPAYKTSKAALNMLTAQYAQQYARDGFTVLAISPGWLCTDLGTDQADISVEKGAEKVLDIIQKATPDQNGKFLNICVPKSETRNGDPNEELEVKNGLLYASQ
ncbi:hypothetical protein PENCOP_c001G01672 [Penicillium coprophilum]|uniref:Uncharacterized protein n=1 Tax=Penicillium coprophilum TaxID=36646 RepID=A0A1V6V782_9EURO|nr:hypothetical protein PENCOP_c001G01672 [Penicillium coprophilum]